MTIYRLGCDGLSSDRIWPEFLANGPDKSDELSRYCSRHKLAFLPLCHQASITPAQTNLSLPGDFLCGFGERVTSSNKAIADLGPEPIAPGRFQQMAPHDLVPSLRDAAATYGVAT